MATHLLLFGFLVLRPAATGAQEGPALMRYPGIDQLLAKFERAQNR